MNLKQFFVLLWARRWSFLLAMFIPVAIAGTACWLWPRSYVAATSLVVEFKFIDPITGAASANSQLLPTYMATQMEIITSHRVAARVVENLKLAKSPAVQEQFVKATRGEGQIVDWLADALVKSVDVKISRDSSLINISYKGNDPKFAAAMANAFADAYMQTNLELKVDPARQNATWFDDQSKLLKANLERAQTKLSEYQKEKGVVAVDERLDVENARLSELSAQLVGVQGQTIDIRTRQRGAGQSGSDSTPEIVSNSLIQGLKADLVRQEAKLTELGERYGRNHPQYERASTEVDTLRAKIDREIANIARSLGETSRSSQQRENEVQTALAKQKAKVLELKQARDRMAVLNREVESAQKIYDNAVQRFDLTGLESRSNLTNIAVLTPAVPPLDYSSPKTILVLAIAIALGGMLGFVVALTREIWDRRVRFHEDVTEALGLPILGVFGRTVVRPRRGMWEIGSRLPRQPGMPQLGKAAT